MAYSLSRSILSRDQHILDSLLEAFSQHKELVLLVPDDRSPASVKRQIKQLLYNVRMFPDFMDGKYLPIALKTTLSISRTLGGPSEFTITVQNHGKFHSKPFLNEENVNQFLQEKVDHSANQVAEVIEAALRSHLTSMAEYMKKRMEETGSFSPAVLVPTTIVRDIDPAKLEPLIIDYYLDPLSLPASLNLDEDGVPIFEPMPGDEKMMVTQLIISEDEIVLSLPDD